MSDRGDELLTELRAHLGTAGVRLSEPLEPLSGGYSNEIARFRLHGAPPPFDQRLVLRVTHDARETAREAIIEDGVADLGCPAPAVLLRGGPRSALGAPFLITALSPGVAFDDTITARTAIGAFRRLPHQLAATMADLHDLPTAAIASHLAAEGWRPDQLDSLAVLAEVDDLASQAGMPELEHRAALLRKHQPPFVAPVLCHGDLHPFNLLFDGDEVTAVLDWELARLADPAFDVGRTLLLLRQAPYPMPRALRRLIQPVASALARRFERSYRERSPIDDARVQWHEALHCLRTLAITHVGAMRPSGDRLRGTADVWSPVASSLEHRFTEIAGRW